MRAGQEEARGRAGRQGGLGVRRIPIPGRAGAQSSPACDPSLSLSLAPSPLLIKMDALYGPLQAVESSRSPQPALDRLTAALHNPARPASALRHDLDQAKREIDDVRSALP